jgi:hypothetical protein
MGRLLPCSVRVKFFGEGDLILGGVGLSLSGLGFGLGGGGLGRLFIGAPSVDI